MFILILAYPGCPGQTAVKWLLKWFVCLSMCMCVCMYVCPGVCVYVACYLCLSVQGYVAWSEIYPQDPETRLLRAKLRTHYDLLMRLLQICCLLVTLHFTVYSSTCMLHSTVYSGCAFDTVGCCPGQTAIKRVCVYITIFNDIYFCSQLGCSNWGFVNHLINLFI